MDIRGTNGGPANAVTGGLFPHDDAAKKLIYLALRGVASKWKRPPQYWAQVKAEFAIRFDERFKLADQ